MLRKQSPREKYFENQNSLPPFCLSLSLESSGQISRQSIKTTYPINSFKVDILCQNSSASFRSIKVCKKNKPPQEIMTPHYDRATGPHGVNNNSTEFRGKSVALQTPLLWSSEMGKVAKGKRKNQPGKRGKTKANETESASAESLRSALI